MGEGVTRLQIGERVAVPWLGYACGNCRPCLTGWETLCEKQLNTGYSVDGCYAGYFLAEAAFAARVPDGINAFEAAPLSCAGVTTYKAIKVGNVRPTDLVAISGLQSHGGADVAIGLAVDSKSFGSIVGTRADLSEVFALHAARRTRVIYEDRDLSEVNEAMDEVLQGRAPARLVLRP
jgi:D-arabinose 1-dehydrogenase-like Zn-dependent alcohol dehydrogenase